MMSRRLLHAACAALALTAFASSATAQSGYPERPIRLLVGFAPGGAADLAARVMADTLSQRLGKPVVIDNRPGAGSTVAAIAASRAEADGYTLLFGSLAMSVQLAVDPTMSFDPLRELAPIGLIAEVPNVLEVKPELPVHSVKELVAYAKTGKTLNYGSSGVGTSLHLSGEILKDAARIDMTHVPYKGSSAALNDLIAGRLDLMFDSLASSLPFIKAGKLRPLAVTSRARSAQLPDVPTMAEAGFANFETSVWFGLFAPKGTPAPIIAKLAAATNDSLAEPQTQRRLTDLSMDLLKSESPEKFGAFFANDIQRWKDTVVRANVVVNKN